MNARQIAHLWAQQTKPKGGSGNFYFVGDTIYSYGSHFPIARFVSPDVVLFTSRGYSNSTSRHKCWARVAVTHKTVHVVNNVLAQTPSEHRANFVLMNVEIESALIGLSRKRDKNSEFDRIKSLADSANAYAMAFKLRQRVVLPDNFKQAAEHALKTRVARDAAEQRRRKAAEKKAAQKQATELAEWLDGKRRHVYTSEVRFRVTGDKVETTMGAEFPVSHCRRVWKFINRMKSRNTDWHKNGECCPVGLFQIDNIDASGNVVAGCHKVEFQEIERLAKLVGVAK